MTAFALTSGAGLVARPAPLGSTVFLRAELPVQRTAVGERRDVVRQPTATLAELECHVTTLAPGQAPHAAHRHPQEEIIVIETGELEIATGGRITRAGPGDVCLFTSNALHAMRNAGSSPARYVVLNFASDEARATAAPAVSLPDPALLRPAVLQWSSLVAERKPTGFRRAVFDGPTPTCVRLECHVTTLDMGKAPHPAHRHPDEELILVREGTIEVTIGGMPHRLAAGDIGFFASNEEHGLKNAGVAPASYYILRVVTGRTPAKRMPLPPGSKPPV